MDGISLKPPLELSSENSHSETKVSKMTQLCLYDTVVCHCHQVIDLVANVEGEGCFPLPALLSKKKNDVKK